MVVSRNICNVSKTLIQTTTHEISIFLAYKLNRLWFFVICLHMLPENPLHPHIEEYKFNHHRFFLNVSHSCCLKIFCSHILKNSVTCSIKVVISPHLDPFANMQTKLLPNIRRHVTPRQMQINSIRRKSLSPPFFLSRSQLHRKFIADHSQRAFFLTVFFHIF